MPQPGNPNPSDQPLVMRSYRRHRKQSRWGTYSLFVPPVALLWLVFWYLMANRQRVGQAPAHVLSGEVWAMIIGCAVISLIGAGLATAGMLDGYYKHRRAAIGLTINAVMLVAAGVIFFLRVFAQSVG